jgi:hypothetical protein
MIEKHESKWLYQITPATKKWIIGDNQKHSAFLTSCRHVVYSRAAILSWLFCFVAEGRLQFPPAVPMANITSLGN